MAEINNDYAYPNRDSYRSMRITPPLVHGYLASIVPTPGGWWEGALPKPWRKTASSKYVKKFQFNPPSTGFDLIMTQTETAASQTPGGNDQSAAGAGVGAANTSLSLFFNREIEVFRASNSIGGVPDYFREIGVQKDVLDIYRVILGEDVPSAIDEDESMQAMMGELFDSASAGRQVVNHPVIVSFNRQLTYYGMVTGMRFEYQKFNYNMVPTAATVNLSIDVLSISSRLAIQNQALTSATSSTPSTGTAVSPATPSSTGSSTSVPNNGFGGPPSAPVGGRSILW